tara:strand:- start:49810 stop:50379 length:570 start_codon:yes stop_codon:yes gene_type:complete
MTFLRKYIKTLLKEYLSRQDLEDVRQTAELVHLGQTRRDGTTGFSHPLGVYNITKKYYPNNKPAQMLALLHDSLEDAEKVGNVSKQEAFNMIKSSIHDEEILSQLLDALMLLTHEKSIPYPEYLQATLNNPLSGIVKISDLIHNLSHSPSPKQIIKYSSALKNVYIPGYIKKEHMKELHEILRERHGTP